MEGTIRSPTTLTMRPMVLLAVVTLLATAAATSTHAAQTEGPPATHKEAVAAFLAGDLVRALDLFETLAGFDPSDGWAPLYVGRIAIEMGQWDVAVASLERAIELGPVRPSAHAYAGEAYVGKLDTVGMFSKLGWAKKARAAFLLAVELEPDNLESRRMLMEFYVFAPGIAGGSIAKASELAEQIASQDPLQGHLAWAQIHESSERLDLVRNDLRAAIELSPDDVGLRLRLAIQLHQARRFEEAWSNLAAALASTPDHPQVLYQQGRTAALSGKHLEDGGAALERYLATAGSSPPLSLTWAWYRLGQVRQHQGNPESARLAFEEALKLDPEHDGARDAIKNLR